MTLLSARAGAQVSTFHLDRLEVWGAPDDGIALFRPATNDRPIFFGQLALGYSLNPLHTTNITSNAAILGASSAGVVQGQFTEYATVGFQFLDRFTVAASLPVTEEWGTEPNYGAGGVFNAAADSDVVNTNGVTTGDARLDLRGVIARSNDRRRAIGAQASVFFPNGGTTDFGGNGEASLLLMISGEYSVRVFRDFNVIGVFNTGVDFRPDVRINHPDAGSGLGVGDEWRFAVGAFLPLKNDKYRLGLSIFGQTGIESTDSIGNTFFRGDNTPLEWQAEGRMRFGRFDRFWASVGVGSRLDQAYGAPDFRIVALAGIYVPILDKDTSSPDTKVALHRRWRDDHAIDTDHDGIPDDIDACPNEPEDHLGDDPDDGCPIPPDRDGDGIPDQYDKCPDTPEDKDGIQDADGCPEDDADHDGIPDTKDACPLVPGSPSPDPKKNGCPQFIKVEGTVVTVLQQVHFATGSTTILPDSFPMLLEIANLLKATTAIHRMSIEGHTDDRGGDDMNMKLSQGRAASVMAWLVQHGIEENRLESHGYGKTKPIADNATDAGRLANRRVEFKILQEGDARPPKTSP
jgi:outer membrane protein OmpA-like peptidoglycan-associated protein